MASTKKPRNADPASAARGFLRNFSLQKKRVVAGLSGGVDSVVLLHVLHDLQPEFGYRLSALHVHHGLSPHAGDWARFCAMVCKRLRVPLRTARVAVVKTGKGPEAAAREARYSAFRKVPEEVIVLAHHLDDQAETVLMNLLRGAGMRGAAGMPARSKLGAKSLLRPMLEVPREGIEAYARARKLKWIEDESNADEALTRNFVRRRLGPLIETRYPAWKRSLARAAAHFAQRDAGAADLLRDYLNSKGLKSPSDARLREMLKQLAAGGARTALEHDGAVVRMYRGNVLVHRKEKRSPFKAREWKGESRVAISALGGELRFRRAKGHGIDVKSLTGKPLVIRLRSGGERLQPDPRRPRRTLKNLFQEAGVPPWERDRVPLLFYGEQLVWVPGLGVDARFQVSGNAQGVVPQWSR